MLIGIIADTHGYIDPRLPAAFAGVDAIVHGGDVGGEAVLAALRAMAALHAVRGNNEEKLGGLGLPLRADFVLAGVRFHLVHQLPQAQPKRTTQVVVFGHSHKALIEPRADKLYVNPGAAGRAGFHRRQTVVLMRAGDGVIEDAAIVELGAREPRQRSGEASARRRQESR
ncbi:MAG: metallophosphoesterase family protein [Dehalococcoidia bacterium]|nr:metallophosphoesterase family protein [Dehalococcoidia bacterium]